MSSCTATGGAAAERPAVYKVVGIILAVSSGLFIGTSFVLKKTGLLKANVKYHEEAGEGYGYLKNAWWWSGMILMIVGEICNFVAYAFVDAILVTPLGALSVVITTILSAIFLKERLSFVGKVGCFMCIVGSVIIVLNAPQQSSAATIQQMQCFVITPGFLTYAGVIIVGCTIIAFWAGPRYGKKSMLVYLSVCSLIGGLSVVATQGLGAAIITQINGKINQFNQWFLYVLFVFVVTTLLTEIVFLNKALNIFNAALVTPTYYVYFTSATIVTSAILFQGFSGTPVQIITIVMGFLTICAGVVLLQLSKSAKDVPDAAVFQGDLDQVRTVAEQEEHESEPKADAIRGTAALIRSFSKSRQKREQDEARRVQSERMEPIGEDEVVEWDGLRRRKTVLAPGETRPSVRRKTIHPPLGLTHFPSQQSLATTHDPDSEHHPHAGLFGGLRTKAATVLNPQTRQRNPSGETYRTASLSGPSKAPYQLNELSATRAASGTSTTSTNYTQLPDDGGDLGGGAPHVLGLPPGLAPHDTDTSYKSPAIQWADKAPTPPPHSNKRTFSFQNVLHPGSRDGPSDDRQPASPGGTTRSPRSPFFRRSHALDSVTEEERLGLVVGDEVTRNEDARRRREREREQGREESDDGLDDGDSDDGFESIGMQDFDRSGRGGGGGGGKMGPGGMPML